MSSLCGAGCLKPTLSSDRQQNSLLPPTFNGSELESLFQQYSSSDGIMLPAHFRRFLSEVQCERGVSEEAAITIMTAFSPETSTLRFELPHFLQYLSDTDHNFAIHTHIHDDMSLPLSHYFIFTGHNSYLSGNQLIGASSHKPVAASLRKGLRVVELDMWPQKDGVSVSHGRTLVSPVEFQKCLTAIKDNAFLKSPYPVIVTLEDHLPPHLQEKAAKEIRETFGDLLYVPDSSEVEQFPSPEKLKRKILISTKRPKHCSVSPSSTKDTADGERECLETVEQSSDEDMLDTEDSSEMDEEWADKPLLESGYERIITMHGGREKGKPLVDALMSGTSVKRVSISEPQLTEIAATHPSRLIEFTRDNILRIYPKQLRIDSSNYNPIKAWAYGAQMAAMNMQGYGKHLWITQGFFRANGGCGYVKKPDYLLTRNSGDSSEIFKWKNTALKVIRMLKIKIYAGCGWREELGENKFDRFSPPDFYTKVGIAGVKADCVVKKTHVVHDKWEPIWDKEFEFSLRVPELAVMRIEVHEADKASPDKFAGQVYLPVWELRSGYRVVTLCDKKGDEWEKVKLLVCIQMSTATSSS